MGKGWNPECGECALFTIQGANVLDLYVTYTSITVQIFHRSDGAIAANDKFLHSGTQAFPSFS